MKLYKAFVLAGALVAFTPSTLAMETGGSANDEDVTPQVNMMEPLKLHRLVIAQVNVTDNATEVERHEAPNNSGEDVAVSKGSSFSDVVSQLLSYLPSMPKISMPTMPEFSMPTMPEFSMPSLSMSFFGSAPAVALRGTALPSPFAVDLGNQPTEQVVGYASQIPSILVQLGTLLRDNAGQDTEGIFRKSPDAGELNLALETIREGGDLTTTDPHLIAALIKEWFRELPGDILTEDYVSGRVPALNEPEASIYTWFLDLMGEIAENQAVNLMSPKALAIVFAPNLLNPDPDGTKGYGAMVLVAATTEKIESDIL